MTYSPPVYTPGPWEAIYESKASELHSVPFWKINAGQGRLTYPDKGGQQIGFGLSGIIRGCDARLIAAAPDMLEALQAIVKHADDTDGGRASVELIEDAEAAIAKATGGAE